MGDTKTAQIMRHIVKYRKISRWEAIQLYRAVNLPDIVYRLRAKGWPITSNWEDSIDINGNHCRYTIYTIPHSWSPEPEKHSDT